MSVYTLYHENTDFEKLCDEIEQVGNRHRELLEQLYEKFPLPKGYCWAGSMASSRPRPWMTDSFDEDGNGEDV